MTIERVAILGSGLMGSGIAESMAAAGLPVVVREIDDTQAEAARRRIEGSLAGAVARGKLDPVGRDEIIARIRFITELDEIADADLVIEAVPRTPA